jgi:hypothetical protein
VFKKKKKMIESRTEYRNSLTDSRNYGALDLAALNRQRQDVLHPKISEKPKLVSALDVAIISIPPGDLQLHTRATLTA